MHQQRQTIVTMTVTSLTAPVRMVMRLVNATLNQMISSRWMKFPMMWKRSDRRARALSHVCTTNPVLTKAS